MRNRNFNSNSECLNNDHCKNMERIGVWVDWRFCCFFYIVKLSFNEMNYCEWVFFNWLSVYTSFSWLLSLVLQCKCAFNENIKLIYILILCGQGRIAIDPCYIRSFVCSVALTFTAPFKPNVNQLNINKTNTERFGNKI